MLRWIVFAFVTLAFALSPLDGHAEPAGGPLAEYVAQPDDSYHWVVRHTGAVGSAEYAELILTSQTWRDVVWKHQLFLIKPSSMRADTSHALLFISGGVWNDEPETGAGRVPRDADRYVALAEVLATPVALLLHVPQQPIFDGLYEDAAIAYTFDQFLRTGDAQWPLLLPMAKSAVRGMDAAQEFARGDWSLDLRTSTTPNADCIA